MVSPTGNAHLPPSLTVSYQSSFTDILNPSLASNDVNRSRSISPSSDDDDKDVINNNNIKSLSPNELANSQEIRDRYGLGSRSLSSNNNLSSNNPNNPVNVLLGSFLSLSTQLTKQPSTIVENEHPLLGSFCAVLECILYHGWKGSAGGRTSFFASSSSANKTHSRDLFTVIIRPLYDLASKHCMDPNAPLTDASLMSSTMSSIENVIQFSGLERAPASRVRAWIRLALMSKCFATNIRLLIQQQAPMINTMYEEGAFIRDRDAITLLINKMHSLDEVIDFNLYIREQDISKHSFPTRQWHRIIRNGKMHLNVVDDDLTVEIEPSDTIIASISEIDLNKKSEEVTEQDKTLHRHIASLIDTNRQLRHAIAMHINTIASSRNALSRAHARMQELELCNKELTEELIRLKSDGEQLKRYSSSPILRQTQ